MDNIFNLTPARIADHWPSPPRAWMTQVPARLASEATVRSPRPPVEGPQELLGHGSVMEALVRRAHSQSQKCAVFSAQLDPIRIIRAWYKRANGAADAWAAS